MKNLLPILFLALLLITGLSAFQPLHAQATGLISYEGTRRIDPSQMRIVVNGHEVRPGSPEFPADLPDTRSFAQTLSFAGDYAREAQEGGSFSVRVSAEGSPDGAGGRPRNVNTNFAPPFEEKTYLNLKDRSAATVLAVKKDDKTTEYRADAPIGKTDGWQLTEQTKKIAGYTCRKATVPFRKETYTVWLTTELPFTYSPIRELTPEKGVVLAVEGSTEQFRATKVDLQAAVAEADVRPTAQVRPVTPAELKELRDKARADFRQRMTDNLTGPGATRN